MFTAQEILDIAIRLETNGEKTYRDARKHTTDAEMKALLDWIADEERNHARWFTELKDRLSPGGEDRHLLAEMSRALVEDVIKGQAFSLQEVDFTAIDTVEKMVHAFIGFEEDTIDFYEVLKSFIDDPAVKLQLDQIIAEEGKHIEQFEAMLPSS
jgi:rubrerythrin